MSITHLPPREHFHKIAIKWKKTAMMRFDELMAVKEELEREKAKRKQEQFKYRFVLAIESIVNILIIYFYLSSIF